MPPRAPAVGAFADVLDDDVVDEVVLELVIGQFTGEPERLGPVRVRIVHAMSGGRSRTTAELCASLPDVPKTTLYRHVGLLAEADVLEVISEQRVHGAVERHYRLRRERATIDADTAASMSLEDHRHGFTAALAALH